MGLYSSRVFPSLCLLNEACAICRWLTHCGRLSLRASTACCRKQTWRHAYQKQVQETEVLKREGGDTALAAQWRQRYEKLSVEKVRGVNGGGIIIMHVLYVSAFCWRCLFIYLAGVLLSFCV